MRLSGTAQRLTIIVGDSDDCEVIRSVGKNAGGGGHAPLDTPGHDR